MAPTSAQSLTAAPSASVRAQLSHNLSGQKLGRKGQATRERILAATRELLDEAPDTPISLSAVARQTPLGMTSLYNYFADLTELLLALLEPVMAEAEDGYIGLLRERWPEAELSERSLAFVAAFLAFWQKHGRMLHLRNSLSDQGDRRMMQQRVAVARPVMALLVKQMGSDPAAAGNTPAMAMATLLYTAIDRTATVATNAMLPSLLDGAFSPHVPNLLAAEARLIEFAIREFRQDAGSVSKLNRS